MQSNKYTNLIRTVLVTGTAFLINYLIQLILTPYITKTVGTEAYGFVSLAKNFTQYATIITAALNSFASRYIAVAYHRRDFREANVYFNSVLFGDAMLATGIFLAMLPVIWMLPVILRIPEEIAADVKLLFLYAFVNFWVLTVFSVFEAAGIIQNKIYITGAFKAASYLTEAAVLCLLFAVLPPRVSYVGLGLLAASLVVAAGNRYVCKTYTAELVIRRAAFSLSAVRKLVIDGIWTSVNYLGETLNSGLDLLVCNLMLTPFHMGQVAIAKTVHTMFTGLYVILNPAFQPMFLRSYSLSDRATLMGELRLSMKVSGMLSNILFAGFASLGLCFYRLWIPEQDIRLIYELTLINCLTLTAGGTMQPLYYIYILTVKKKVPCLITIAGGLLNVLGMYLLIRHTGLGVYAVVWTTAVISLTMNLLTNPVYMAHVLGLPYRTFYPDILLNLLSCAVITVVFRLLAGLYQPHTWAGLAACACGYALIGALLHLLLACSREDRSKMRRFLKTKGQTA